MSFSKYGPCLALALTLSACNDGKGPGNPDAYQGKDGVNGNECSQQFVAEYNDLARTARYIQSDLAASDTTSNREQTRSDAQSLKDKATALRNKYANVICVALLDSALNGTKESIDVNSRMDVAIQAANLVLTNLDQQGSGGDTTLGRASPPASSGNEQCSSSFIDDYLAVTHYAKTVSDDLEVSNTPANRERTKADAQRLKDQAKAFRARHAGYICDVGTGSSRYSIDVDAKMSDLVAIADKVIDLLNRGGSAQPARALFAPGWHPSIVPIQVISQ